MFLSLYQINRRGKASLWPDTIIYGILQNQKLLLEEDTGYFKSTQPFAEKENEFIKENGFSEYAKWHLGVEDEEDEDNKVHYKFPYRF
jgi:hypothetical protein